MFNLFSRNQTPPSDGVITINVPNPGELYLVKECNTIVNFWKKPDMKSINVYISTQTFVNGTGLIGVVPSKYFKHFASMLDNGVKVRGKIMSIAGNTCDIKIDE